MRRQASEPTAEALALSAWNAAFLKANASEEVPEGFYTRSQLEDLWKLKKCMVILRLQKLRKLGYVEERKFVVTSPFGVLRPTPHYRLK